MKAAVKLQAIRDDWAGRAGELDAALTYNRKLWTILVSSATADDSPLPPMIKNNIASLGVFVFNQTMQQMTEPKVDRLSSLVNINRELAAGLRSAPEAVRATAGA
jgi:flagellar protein FlaF